MDQTLKLRSGARLNPHLWLVDVVCDLKGYATQNDLHRVLDALGPLQRALAADLHSIGTEKPALTTVGDPQDPTQH